MLLRFQPQRSARHGFLSSPLSGYQSLRRQTAIFSMISEAAVLFLKSLNRPFASWPLPSRELLGGDVTLRELSLHILDLIENSIRSGASVISVTVTEDHKRDLMEIMIEDNGPGLRVPFEVATDPFYTTKNGKKTGLGLSLLRFRAEQAGGKLTLEKSELGGLVVKATMQLNHIDRSPLGDLAATLSLIVCTNPDIDLRCRICVDDREWVVSVAQILQELPLDKQNTFTIAGGLHQQIHDGLRTLQFLE